jgi:prepilin-type N-terminal cleavage/methylation domain-containing protein
VWGDGDRWGAVTIRDVAKGSRGFTIIEVIVVLTIGAVIAGMGTLAFSGYFQRDSARRAAQVFAQDLVAARGYAIRSQEAVVIRFFESTLWYQVASQSSTTEIARRRFGGAGDIDLSGVTLDTAGDSLVFDPRGMADMSGAGGPVGTATFSSGATTYTVSFNGMGASRIDRT